MRLLCIRQPYYFNKCYVKTENFSIRFFLYYAQYIYFKLKKVEAKMLLRKELEPTGYVTWEVPNNEKIIAITFDDGPDPTYTPQILNLLRQYKAEATFFYDRISSSA